MQILIDLIQRNNWVMYPLLLGRVLIVGLILERLLTLLRQCQVLPVVFLTSINNLLEQRQYEQVPSLSGNNNYAAARQEKDKLGP
ncbi:MAG: hypothetical protein AMR96_04035 [Candidatus Adiutrix intracellularis]|nr:MAG: hypothetical protein AMR96_04035 [Candidatus Adiutrix intracellularis]